jgi:hypothetical protein
MIVAFVGFSRIFLLGILMFKGLTARRLYKSFGVKGLMAFGSSVLVILFSMMCLWCDQFVFLAVCMVPMV